MVRWSQERVQGTSYPRELLSFHGFREATWQTDPPSEFPRFWIGVVYFVLPVPLQLGVLVDLS